MSLGNPDLTTLNWIKSILNLKRSKLIQYFFIINPSFMKNVYKVVYLNSYSVNNLMDIFNLKYS